MRNLSLLAILSTMLFAAPSALACDYPQRASVPDGATATKEEMISGQRDVKSYMAAMEAYLSCIESAEEFNIQVRAFKERNK